MITVQSLADTSAWAGIHYHAGRQHDEKGPLTWPEAMDGSRGGSSRNSKRTFMAMLWFWKIREEKNGFKVFTQETEYTTQFVVFAAPTFMLRTSWKEGSSTCPRQTFQYSPWLTAKPHAGPDARENG